MNSVKLQDTKLIHRDLLHFCTLTMKDQKQKLWKQAHLPLHKTCQGIDLPKDPKKIYKRLTKEMKEDQKKKKKMEKYTMLLDYKNEY